jgi:hypothetical protein
MCTETRTHHTQWEAEWELPHEKLPRFQNSNGPSPGSPWPVESGVGGGHGAQHLQVPGPLRSARHASSAQQCQH